MRLKTTIDMRCSFKNKKPRKRIENKGQILNSGCVSTDTKQVQFTD